jgi:hypothetical protein
MPMQKVVIDPKAAMEKFHADMAAMAVGKTPSEPKKRRLPLARFGPAGHFRGDIVCATFPMDWEYQEILHSDVWDLVAPRVVIGSKIECRNDNLTWYAELIVVSATLGRIEVRELMHRQLAPANSAGEERGAYRLEYRGVTDRWVVIRTADDREMARDLPSRDEARSRVGQFEQTATPSGIVGRA